VQYLALCYPSNILDLNAKQLQYIPKIVLLRVYGDYIDYVWDKPELYYYTTSGTREEGNSNVLSLGLQQTRMD